MELTSTERRAVKLLLVDDCPSSGPRKISERVADLLRARGFPVQTERPLHEPMFHSVFNRKKFIEMAKRFGLAGDI